MYNFHPLWVYGEFLLHLAVLNICQKEWEENGVEFGHQKFYGSGDSRLPSASIEVEKRGFNISRLILSSFFFLSFILSLHILPKQINFIAKLIQLELHSSSKDKIENCLFDFTIIKLL